MRLLFLIFTLFVSFAAISQPLNYGYRPTRERVVAFLADSTFHLPAGSSVTLRTGGYPRAGALFYDSVGADSGLYIRGTGNSWRKLADSDSVHNLGNHDLTQSESLRSFNVNSGTLNFTGTGNIIFGANSYTSLNYKAKIKSDSYTSNGLFVGDSSAFTTGSALVKFSLVDSMTQANQSSMKDVAFMVNRIIVPSEQVLMNNFINGSQSRLSFQLSGDSISTRTQGGDFISPFRAVLSLNKKTGYTGRSVISTYNERIASESAIANLGLFHSGGSASNNWIRARGWWGGLGGYLLLNPFDTVDNYNGVISLGFISGKVKKLIDFNAYTSFCASGSSIDTSIGFVSGHSSTYNVYNGPTSIGGMSNTNAAEGIYRYAHSSSILDISDSTRGILIPRMNTTKQNAISSPATGLLIYNTDSLSICQYNGTAWRMLSGSGGGGVSQSVITDTLNNYWRLSGNNTTAGVSFLGTTNNTSLRFRTNNVQRGYFDSTGRLVIGNVAKFTAYDGGSGTLLNIKQSGNGFDGGISMQNAANDATTMNYTVGGIASDQTFGLIALGGNIYHNVAHSKFGDNGTGTAKVHIAAGSSTANTAPLKFTSGTNLTTAEAGAVEYDGTELYFTPASTRYKLAQVTTGGSTVASGAYTSTLTNTTNITSSTQVYYTYTRVGSIVHFAIKLDVNATAGGATELGISIPVASDFTTADQVSANVTSLSEDAILASDGTNNRLTMTYTAQGSGSDTFYIVGQYTIL